MPSDFGLKLVVTIPKDTAISRDKVQNVFHFVADDGHTVTTGDITNITADVAAFYNTTPSGATQAIKYYIQDTVNNSSNACTTQGYTFDTVKRAYGLPKGTGAFTMGTGSGAQGLPAECAVALSFRALKSSKPEHGPGGTRPAANYRNRIYLGPLNVSACDDGSATGDIRVASAFRTTVTKAAKELATAVAARGFSWSVFSPAKWSWSPVEDGWCDDAFDSQRRRGPDPISKTLFTI